MHKGFLLTEKRHRKAQVLLIVQLAVLDDHTEVLACILQYVTRIFDPDRTSSVIIES